MGDEYLFLRAAGPKIRQLIDHAIEEGATPLASLDQCASDIRKLIGRVGLSPTEDLLSGMVLATELATHFIDEAIEAVPDDRAFTRDELLAWAARVRQEVSIVAGSVGSIRHQGRS